MLPAPCRPLLTAVAVAISTVTMGACGSDPAGPTAGGTSAADRTAEQGRRLPGLPPDFVRVRDVIPQALFEIRYHGDHNFIGRPVRGYSAPECWLTRRAAEAMAGVQERVAQRGYRLKFYDCFRPRRAVSEFASWARDPKATAMKAEFYPTLEKNELFPKGYIAAKSGHSRGSTLDVTLVRRGDGLSPDWRPGDPLVACTAPVGERFADTSIDMGTGFDCFNPRANTANPAIRGSARANRRYLVREMSRAGFENLPEEWWHYTLRNEPYPNTYFDAEITSGTGR